MTSSSTNIMIYKAKKGEVLPPIGARNCCLYMVLLNGKTTLSNTNFTSTTENRHYSVFSNFNTM